MEIAKLGKTKYKNVLNDTGNSDNENNSQLINETRQKEFNMEQIKQGLHFTNKILNILNPDRGVKTYNAYGKMKK